MPADPRNISDAARAAAIVILTFRPAPGMLEATVRSVLSTSPDVPVFVVDNGDAAGQLLDNASIDGRPLSDMVTVISTGHNGGYAVGMNIGIREALATGAAAVALLNDDVVVADGWLGPLLAELESDPEVGVAQPLLLYPDSEIVNSAGVTIDRFGQGSDVGRDLPVSEVSSDPTDIEVFTGGAVVLSRAFIEDVGGFDERFFLYYEDVELARRGARAGWRYRLVPGARVWHRGSATTETLGDEMRRLQERNRLVSTALHGSGSELAHGIGLSVRRLRHAPRRAHAQALWGSLWGVPAAFIDRLRSHPPAAVRRVGGRLVARGDRRRAGRVSGTPGVNIVGYHHISSGLGSNARELSAALTAAGVPVIEIDNDMSTSPRRRPARPVPDDVHDTTIAIVTAFEFPYFCARFPQLVGPEKRMIGYWVWELSDVPAQHIDAMVHVDEIWAPTTFVQNAYRRVAPDDVPVRLAPFRMEEPEVDRHAVAQWRRAWGDDTVFVVSFDYLSVVERKNPLGAIAAFRKAFPDGDGVRLIVKSINGEQRRDDVATIRDACGGDERIELLDEHFDDARHHALLAAADCLVSLHRSEGYGLHPAIAMAVGTAVLATRYSGVVDFLDDRCAAMVDASLVPVTNGQGIYPDTAMWADPDLDQAAAAMRRLVREPDYRSALAQRARRRITDQPTAAQFGEAYAAVLRDSATRGHGVEPFFLGLDRARGRLGRIRVSLPGRVAAWPDTARR